MKKIILGAALVLSAFAIKPANAQVNFNLNLNIGSQPEWGPVGYDHVEYYYMPDIDAYYYVPTHQYVYFQNNAWMRSTRLPDRYRNFNLYNSYKVVINEREPWRRADVYRNKYAGYRGRQNQVIIRDSRDARYRNHWKDDRRDDREWRSNNRRSDRGRPEVDYRNNNSRPERGRR
ncbi:hypothetical protein [Mucilaginibacter myungsuensis]|uniref:YXWGXW repeat-containing protein n=1 Tax=Mucilaginibacter myungsuensis TaxID=649104 RepID=A0A929KX62_9SPHI|nr:hypothetical protein [Mucilaginibacter myungsuensis]MBE9663281.1 hypothetical protein [Mucilaginibacter myungsuensis]MDN3600016.1 hypothetical protein [Mucilaginibacter myungsuensis]